ncbi:MAG: efflux RND transporter permease subunit [Bacteroidales bacterium]|nr:efflux RND transporter permease subunit [Bacteroidales bacterium]
MKIYEAAVKKPITTLMVFIAVIVVGVYSLSQLAIDYFPEIEFPTITILTTYPGANSENIEQNITKPIEEQVSALNNLKKITSRSSDNISIVTAEFNYGTNLDEAANDIRNVLDRVVPLLPSGVDRPTILKFSTSQMPILFYAVTANKNYEGISKILEEKVINQLNRINGVASVMTIGTPKRTIYVEFDPLALNNYGITFDQIAQIVKAENLNLPIGSVKTNDLEYKISLQGEFQSADQIKNTVLTFQNGKTIRIKDIATVTDTLKDRSIIERINSGKGLRLLVMKQSGSNTVKVANKVKAEMEKILPTLPSDVKIEPIFDTSRNILTSIRNLSETILFALLFVSIVVIFFLGRWRPSLIVLAVIPISLMSGLVYLYASNNSLNIITLSAISIAIGMVVDDAIVVLENIIKHIERGSTRREAAIYGTNEVWVAVIATTVVIVAVFMPLTLLTGFTGALFNSFGWIISITIVVSTIAAISFTPMLSSQILKSYAYQKEKRKITLWDKTIGKALNQLDEFYKNSISFVLRHKISTLIVAILIFVFSVSLMKFIGADFLPQSDQSMISAKITLQTGIKVEKTEETMKKLEQILHERYPNEVVAHAISAGASDEASFISAFSANASNVIQLMVRFKDLDHRSRSVFSIGNDLRSVLDSMPEVIKYDITYQAAMGGMGSNNIDVKIFSFNLDQSMVYAKQLAEKIKNIEGAKEVLISQESDKPEIKIFLKQEKMAQMGLNSAMVGAALRNYLTGFTASKLKEEGKEYDIVFRLNNEIRHNIELFKNITIRNMQGNKVFLSDIADLRELSSPPVIEHENKQRMIKISVKPQGRSLNEVATDIEKTIAQTTVPQHTDVVVGGAYQDQQESFRDLALLMLVASLLVYLTMAAQFESFTMPIIIMIAIPFAFSGVFIALFITGISFSVNSLLGAFMLIGIAVKNSIILVDFTNLLRDRGMKLFDALVEAGRSRLRPILMTALTTILGMLPLALSTGEGSEQWAPIGISVIGGLIFTTVLTLIIVPVLYYILIRSGSRRLRKKFQSEFSLLDEVLPK